MKCYYFCLVTLLLYSASIFSQSNKFTLSGYVSEKGSKEHLPGANLYIPKFKAGATTNNYGFYSITIPKDSIELIVSFTGYQKAYFKLFLNKDTLLDVSLEPETLLKEVVVKDKLNQESRDIQMSRMDVSVEQIKELPSLLGEKDVFKTLQLLPGVQKGSEGSSGLYIRGGGPDQNLIILDEATVYNATHLFGFFSLFNGDALKNVELTKGGFPARYGGRLSSVVNLQMREGDKESIHGNMGIGLIASRLTLEGPIKKDKISFLVSARRTYLDILTKPFMKKSEYQVGYFFYDVNLKLNYTINYKNKVYVSSYSGNDKFSLFRKNTDENNNEETFKSTIQWGNATGTIRWNHLINEKIFSNLSLIFTDFLFDIGFKNQSFTDQTQLRYFSGIRDYSIKADIDYYPGVKHRIKGGILATYHYFRPNAVVLKGPGSNMERIIKINTYENAAYIEDNYDVSDNLGLNAGLRLTHFNVRNKSYFNPEPRISIRYNLPHDFSIKASYSNMNQYVHLLSNSGIGLPSDLWIPATNRIRPQSSNQIALGLSTDLDIRHSPFLISLETYYKSSKNIIGYKEGASFIRVGNISPGTASSFSYEDIVTSGNAESYGAEFFMQKKAGKFTAWAGYTLSWTWLTFNELNSGKRFPARYDRRHDISIAGTYKLNEHIHFSFTWVYGTGNAITMPLASYQIAPAPPVYNNIPPPEIAVIHGYSPTGFYSVYYDYGSINNVRMPANHRLDIGVQFIKKRKKYERVFEASIYNVYNRQNPFFYQNEIDYRNKTSKLIQVSLFPIIPSVSWAYKF